MNSSNPWKQRLEQVPELEPYLRKVAAKWAKGSPLPKQMMLGPEPKAPAVRAALDRIFGGHVFYRNGKLSVEIPAALREEAVFAPLAALLGIEKEEIKQGINPVEILQRLRLSHPQMDMEWLQTSPEVARLLSSQPEREQLVHQLLKTASFLQSLEIPTTLSKLGSIFFNDSKILRGGTPRKLLGGLMNAQLGMDDTPDNREIALQQFNVIDNPATTLVSLFGPVGLVRNGKQEGWIVDRFNAGEPVTLNSYNLQGVEAVELPAGLRTVITSENAAPFHELVAESISAIIVYTGGYPNAAVCRLLRLLAQADADCRHWGDTDPDGFQIAAMIARIIPVSLFRCSLADMQEHAGQLKPLPPEKIDRGRQMLKKQPGFLFRKELAFALTHGWLEQERMQKP